MKRLFLISVIICFTFTAKAIENKNVTGNDNSALTETSSSASVAEVLVYANNAVDDFCNYFNGSWVDIGLTVYCSFGGDVYTCTAYKVLQVACTVNGAVKLYIEGDIESAIKKALQGTSKIYTMSKLSRTEFQISDTRANMTPRNEWY